MPSGGRLTIRGRADGDVVEVAVTDTGVGIAPADLGRIMEPLYSTKARGLGLGLALVRMILERNGGRLDVASEPGRGSTFSIRLAVARQGIRPHQRQGAPHPRGGRGPGSSGRGSHGPVIDPLEVLLRVIARSIGRLHRASSSGLLFDAFPESRALRDGRPLLSCKGWDGVTPGGLDRWQAAHWGGPCGTSATCSRAARLSAWATGNCWRYAHSRDETAFEALVARHGPMVLATCRAILKHDHDVEDAFQATFLVLARKAGSVRAGDTLGGWLHRVAYRAAVQLSVESSRRRRHEAEAAMTPLSTIPPEVPSEIASVVHEELDRLPDRQRLPLVLCDLEGLTYQQAAGRLRWTEPTLRRRLLEGRRRLRSAWPGAA